MNFELDAYIDASKDFPSKEVQLETYDNVYYHFKTDVFKGLMSYSTAQNFGANIITITAERAKEVIALNKKGIKPDSLLDKDKESEVQRTEFDDGVGEDINRFDIRNKNQSSKNSKKPGKNKNQNKRAANENSDTKEIRKPLKINLKNNKNNISNEA
jgi:hypothetical protein